MNRNRTGPERYGLMSKRVSSGSGGKSISSLQLEVVHPHAAGIDVGGSEHFVAIDPRSDDEPVRRFDCFTTDLIRMADWLEERGIQTVALQATGVYRVALYEILESRAIRVFLVNARHTKNLPGRKSDDHKRSRMVRLSWDKACIRLRQWSRVPVAAAIAHLRTAAQQLSTSR